MNYPFQDVEKQAQQLWQEHNLFVADENHRGDKFYCLSMFPYPSGRLHMGHVRNYTIGDVLARYRRMQGDNVLQPMGWDAFGLPAENAAIEHNIAPAEWTYRNIEEMRQQLMRLGLAVDWRREFATCDADYYRWEQQLFVRLFKKGLVYKKTGTVNWDPVDNTVLANEQVVDGKGWRSGAVIERRDIPMYFMAITRYNDELIDELETLTGWPDSVKTMQRNWIGRSQGARVFAPIVDSDDSLEFYTTRPDTIYGMTFCAIAPEHPLALATAKDDPQLQEFIESCRRLAVNEQALETVEKQGYLLPFHITHPLDDTISIPVYVANYILMQYGTGAIYGVPAHDQRDLDFARRYDLPVIPVVSPDGDSNMNIGDTAYTGGGMMINSRTLNGLENEAAKQQAITLLQHAKRGSAEQQYRLHDWGISRQRYWGCPIPIIHCSVCGDIPETEENLPVRLPQNVIIERGGSPLSKIEEFVNCQCPQCGAAAKRETDTMDTFVESSWYYARFASHDCTESMIDERAAAWLPVNQYIGGIEHACLHLLYARFFQKLMRDSDMFPANDKRYNEPFTNLLCQGMVLKDGSKMSKSKGNTVDPQQLIDTYGADTARLFILFAAPPEQALEWSENGVRGSARFLNRLWQTAENLPQWMRATTVAEENADKAAVAAGKRQLNLILKKADYDMQRMRYNNIPSAAMQIVNLLQAHSQTRGAAALLHEGMSIVLRLLAPAVPHITQVLWVQLKMGDIIANAPWPQSSDDEDSDAVITMIVQVNGKKRGQIEISINADAAAIEHAAQETVSYYLKDQSVKKIIVVAKKLVNIVV